MLDTLWLEFTNLFSTLYSHYGVTFSGMPLSADMFGHLAVGIVGLLAVSAPFLVFIKFIQFVTGGYTK